LGGAFFLLGLLIVGVAGVELVNRAAGSFGRVEHLTGAVNGAQNGEYWRLTTTDGTQYYFGRNRLPGWVSGNPETNSTWTVPVFGDDAGEPCHQSTFAASWCQQAYRWNLDNIVDVHGNSLAHYYAKETNYYGRNLTASAGTSYVRGGYLLRTEYGLRAGAEYSTPALAMAVYTVAERCLRSATDCAESNIAVHPEYWPDVPADRLCAAGATCTGKFSPTFFTRKMLTAVTTRVRSGTGYTWCQPSRRAVAARDGGCAARCGTPAAAAAGTWTRTAAT